MAEEDEVRMKGLLLDYQVVKRVVSLAQGKRLSRLDTFQRALSLFAHFPCFQHNTLNHRPSPRG